MRKTDQLHSDPHIDIPYEQLLVIGQDGPTANNLKGEMVETQQRLNLLLAASNLLAEAENLTRGLQDLAHLMVRHMGASFCHIFLLDPENEYLTAVAVSPLPDDPTTFRWQPGLGRPTAVAEWPRLNELLYEHPYSVIKTSSQTGRGILQRWSRQLELETDIQSMLVAPLRSGRRTLGLLALGEMRPWQSAPINQSQIELTLTIARQTAVLIERLQAHEESQRRSHLLATLDETSRRILAQQNTARLRQDVIRLAAELVGCTASGLFYAAGNGLTLADVYGLPPEWVGRQISQAEGIIGHAARTGSTLSTNDYPHWPEQDALFAGLNLQTVVAIPLKQDQQVTAVLFIADAEQAHRLFANDIDILERFALQAAIGLEKARLLNQSEQARQRLHQFYQASNTLVSSRDPRQVWQDIVTQAKEVTAAAGVRMFLIDQHTGQVTDLLISEDDQVNVKSVIRPNGLSTMVVRTGQPQIVEDYQQARDRANPSFFVRGIQAAAGLPVSIEGERMGVMWVYYDSPRTFSDSEIEAMQLFVNQAAIAYENARKMNELEHMRQAAEMLAHADGLPAVLNQIVESACQVLRADSAVIWSYDESRLEFIPEDSVVYGIPEDVWLRSRKQGPRPGGTTDTVLQMGWLGMHNVDDLETYPFMGDSTLLLLRGAGVRSFQGMALCVGEEKLGTLYVNYNRPKTFTAQEQEIAQTFANHAALALRNARLLTQLGQARETTALIADATTLADLPETLAAVAAGIYHAWHCDLVTIHVYDQERDLLIPPPTVHGVLHYEVEPDMRPSRLVRTLLEQGPKLIVTEDTLTDPLFTESHFRLEEEVVSCVAVRLQMSRQMVGMLFINYRQPHHFTENELRHIELSANQAAIAIHNAQLYERKQRRTAALEALYQAGQAVTASLNQQQILDHIAEQSWRLVSFPGRRIGYCSIWLVEEGVRARVVSAYPREELQKTRQAVGPFVDWAAGDHGRTGIMHRAYKTRQPQLVPNVDDDPDYLRSHKETRSELVMPIILEEDVVGIINVEHSEYAAFDKEDIRALEALAAQAAIAMKNAQLYDTAVRQARLLHLAAQVAGHANSTLDEQKLLKKIVHAIATDFGFYHVAIFLMDEKREHVVMRAASSENGQVMVRDGYKLKVGEQGLVGQVAQDGRYQIVNDVSQNNRYLRNPLLLHTRSETTFPLIARGQVIGVLDLQHRGAGGLQEDEISTLEMMTNQIANAIHNAQLYSQAGQQAVTLQALYDAGQAVVESLNLDEILTNLVEQAWKLTGTQGLQAEFSCLLLENGSYLTFEAAYPPETLTGLRQRPGRIDLSQPQRYGVTGRAFKTGEPQLVTNVRQDPHYLPYSEDTTSELAVPIKIEGYVVGVINVEHSQPGAFDERDQETLVALATQAAIAIQNANTYREAQILQDVASSLAGAVDEHEVMELVLAAALKLTRASSASFLFWDEANECFSPAYTVDEPGQALRPYQTTARRRGFTRNVVRTRRPVFIYDALYVTNANPTIVQKGRRSLIGIPVLSEGNVIAVMHIFNILPRHYSRNQIALLETLAAQAGVAIAKMRHLEELKKTRGQVGAYTALAWMGMASNAWRHSITADAVNIRNAADMVNVSLATAVDDDTQRQKIKDKLNLIHTLSERVMSRPITPPLSSEEGAARLVINDLIRERMAQLWEDDKYAVLSPPTLRLEPSAGVLVWASAEWLRLALDLVVDNAIDAMKHSSVQRLTIETALNQDQVEIAVQDTGPGIPEALLPELFKGSLKRPRREGHLGRGLLMVQAIVQTYGGDVFARNAPDRGATLVLSLPVHEAVSG